MLPKNHHIAHIIYIHYLDHRLTGKVLSDGTASQLGQVWDVLARYRSPIAVRAEGDVSNRQAAPDEKLVQLIRLHIIQAHGAIFGGYDEFIVL